MTESDPELIDRMMVRCGRRCCICRRFRPTKLQVHHIVERSEGGSDDEDNLIVTCFSCHSDVHTKVPFARRFSVAELKGLRDVVTRLVEVGTLAAGDTDDTVEAVALIVGGVDQFSYDDHRRQARYKKALDQLLQCRLVEWRCDQILDVTYAGYLAADEMLSSGPGFLSS
jgi:hypothetical protein